MRRRVYFKRFGLRAFGTFVARLSELAAQRRPRIRASDCRAQTVLMNGSSCRACAGAAPTGVRGVASVGAHAEGRRVSGGT